MQKLHLSVLANRSGMFFDYSRVKDAGLRQKNSFYQNDPVPAPNGPVQHPLMIFVGENIGKSDRKIEQIDLQPAGAAIYIW